MRFKALLPLTASIRRSGVRFYVINEEEKPCLYQDSHVHTKQCRTSHTKSVIGKVQKQGDHGKYWSICPPLAFIWAQLPEISSSLSTLIEVRCDVSGFVYRGKTGKSIAAFLNLFNIEEPLK